MKEEKRREQRMLLLSHINSCQTSRLRGHTNGYRSATPLELQQCRLHLRIYKGIPVPHTYIYLHIFSASSLLNE